MRKKKSQTVTTSELIQIPDTFVHYSLAPELSAKHTLQGTGNLNGLTLCRTLLADNFM
jgi:hypothetical protein